MMAWVYVFFRFTRWGLALRAAAQHPEAARWLGLPVSWMLAWGWGLAAMVGAVAGVLIAPMVYLEPNMMMNVLLYAFAAAVLGGLNSPPGAVLGGLVVGVLDNWLGAFVVGHELKQPMALLLIVLVLALRPQGLLGTAPGRAH
jgi:branched-chain amino acid transport system permease protein